MEMLHYADKETTSEYLQVIAKSAVQSKTRIFSLTPQRFQKLVVDSFHSHLVLSLQSDFLLRVP